jgi:hypothetical protein
MFGHSIHLPDVNTPEAAPDELSSGALMVLPRPTAEEIQPFLPDRTTRPAQQLPQVPIQAPVVSVQPLKRAELFHEPEPSRTDVLSGVRHRVRGRTAFVVITVAAAAGVVFAWLYSGDGAYGPPPPPRPIRVPGRTALSPTAVTPPSATATAPTPPVEVPEIVVPAPPPPARAAAVAPEPSLPAPTPEKPRRRERRSATAAPDRNAIPLIDAAGEARPVEAAPVEAKAPAPVEPKNPAEPKAIAEPKPTAEPKGEVKPGKVGKRKKAELEDDPDATLPPSD